MTTIATNNAAVSPTIYSSGLSSQTAHTAQFNRKLQPFYAKQTQFPKPEMDLTPHCKTAYGDLRVCSPRKNKPNFNPPIEDRSLSRLVGAVLLFRAFSFSCFEFISDLDIRISCFNPIYAKQTQFAAHPNERNYCTNNGLSKYQTIQTPEKQTQYCSALEIRPRRIHAAPPANLRRRRNKINQTCFRFFKSPQKSPKTTRFPNFFSLFLTFSQFSARFRAFSPPISAFVSKCAPKRTNLRICVDFLLESPP